MSEENNYDYKAIDAVVNIWTREALSQRPDWGDDFFVGKMNAKDSLMTGLSLDETLERMETAGIEKAFLIHVVRTIAKVCSTTADGVQHDLLHLRGRSASNRRGVVALATP